MRKQINERLAMKYQIAFVLLAILSINFVSIIAYEYDEYYCRNHPYYQICHRCKDVDEICDRQEQGCYCDNIAIFHDAKRKFNSLRLCRNFAPV